MIEIGLGHYLTLGAIIFFLGVMGIFLNRKNVIVILMSIELILLAVNINLISFSIFSGNIIGQIFTMLILTVAAAEAAISSPLLEDIDLAGANGILVNVTAGEDLSIGEFQEIGEAIKEFASPDATVVIGWVSDKDLENEIRVTVVATGLGQAVGAGVAETLRVVKSSGALEPNYTDLEKPTVQRQREVDDDSTGSPEEMEALLDIPAFLRRQAD